MLRISPSLGMLGIEEDTRRLAEDILSVLVTRPGERLKESQYAAQFPGVDADQVVPGVFIGNK